MLYKFLNPYLIPLLLTTLTLCVPIEERRMPDSCKIMPDGRVLASHKTGASPYDETSEIITVEELKSRLSELPPNRSRVWHIEGTLTFFPSRQTTLRTQKLPCFTIGLATTWPAHERENIESVMWKISQREPGDSLNFEGIVDELMDAANRATQSIELAGPEITCFSALIRRLGWLK